MRKLILATVIGVALWAIPASSAQAQYRYGYSSGVWVQQNPVFYNPYFSPISYPSIGYNQTNRFVSPYYRNFNTTNYYQTPFGVQVTNFNRINTPPVASGPLHSVYWNPFTNSYSYGSRYTGPVTNFSSYYLGW
jgi:hypothetical protein